jgi:hypothetical protein
MGEPVTERAGWSALKIIGLILGLLAMVGFSLVALCGIIVAAGVPDAVGLGLTFAVPGVLLAVGGLLLVREMIRRARAPKP